MPKWHCGSRYCDMHDVPNEVCPEGEWTCRRIRPPCERHREAGDNCRAVEGALWNCGAAHCGRHPQRDHVCPRRNGPWYCELVIPACPGHQSHEDDCDPERARARECSEEPDVPGDAPSDGSGHAHRQLAPTRTDRTESDGTRTTTVDLRSRACQCPRCNPCGTPFPSGDAPTDLVLENTYVFFNGYFRTPVSPRGITFPIEFLAVETPKVITLACRHESFRWPWTDDFDDYTQRYRFRTDHPHVEVALFRGDNRIHYTSRNELQIKLLLTPRRGAASGDRVRLILQCRPSGRGQWRDLACLPGAVVFAPLSRLRGIHRYFGRPDWSADDVGFFLDPSCRWFTIRLTARHRQEMRSWLDEPLAGHAPLGIGTREQALVVGIAVLAYLDEQFGETVAEFFGDPIGFIREKLEGRVQSKAEELTEEQRSGAVRSTWGRMLQRVDARSRQQWIWARRAGAGHAHRAGALMAIADWITGGAQIAVESVRVANFVDSVLRTDTIYTTEDLPFFVSFELDPTTGVPNGVVAVNLIPDGTFRWLWHVDVEALMSVFLFWESANAYYLPLLNVDRRVRQAFAAAARSESDGKTECYMCHRSAGLDRVCSVCSQAYHWDCMEWEFGAADCPRCLQRDVVDPIDE